MLVPFTIPTSDVCFNCNAPVHRIFCIDCSGSMSSDLPRIIHQLKNKIPTCIRPQDFLSLIWFSGKNEYGTIFEHISIEDLKDVSRIHQALDRYLKTVGLTGFVEPVGLARQIAEKYSDQAQIFFLTDGQENQWSRDECEAAFASVSHIPFVIVEYKYYCDRNLLQSLGRTANAENIFNEDFEKYEATFENYMTNNVSSNRQCIPSDKPLVYFENGIIKMAMPDTNDLVSIPDTVTQVYQYDESRPFFESTERVITDPAVELSYKMILYFFQNRNLEKVQECLNQLGDVYTARMFYNCFSKQDYANFGEHLLNCIQNNSDESPRFKNGVDLEYRPKSNAFNVIQLLKLLVSDKDARFYPYHSSFKYSSISKAVEQKVKFVPTRELGAKFNLVYNKSRANISLGCRIYGYEIEGEEVRATTAFRNYAVLKDGIKNILKLPFSMSQNTFDILKSEDCIDVSETFVEGRVYTVDITNLPVVNRMFTTQNKSIEFCRYNIDLLKLKADMKYLKWVKKTRFPQFKSDDEEEVEYTKEDKDDGRVRDYYMAPELQVKIAKCSSLPTINDKMIQKLESGGKLTVSEALMLRIHNMVKAESNLTEETVNGWIRDNQIAQGRIGEYLEQVKMAILVGGWWFSDAPASQHDFRVDEFEVNVDVKDVKVYLN